MSSKKVFIFSAPSGAGKTTIIKHLLQNLTSQLSFSISACSRAPRQNEVNGKDYHFLSVEDFKKGIENASPSVEVKSRRIGGATYQVPIEVPRNRAFYLASLWLINSSNNSSGKPMSERLAIELISAASGDGGAIKKKEDTHRMADANKAFAHFR